jgi:hypothetical protein
MHFVGLSPNGPHPNAPGDPSTPRFNGSQVQSSSFFNSKFKFLLMRESNIHVTGFSNGSNIDDVMGRVSHSRADFDVAATASRWILVITASSRASRPEFQHSSHTFGLGILVVVMGSSSWRASPAVGNATVDDTNVAATFFSTDDKTYLCLSIVTFVIRASVERLVNSSIYV